MNRNINNHLNNVYSHLYVNPLEKCNLRCKICYTRKTSPILEESEILDFIARYQKVHTLESVTFCGGEVFTLPYFPKLVNTLTQGVYFSDSAVRARWEPLASINVPWYSRTQLPRSSKHTPFRSSGRGIYIQIITNGTIDKLDELKFPNLINLIVSIDGLPKYHDKNRGVGNFKKSMSFLKKARKLGFHTEIFSIVTKQNYDQVPEFEEYINNKLNQQYSFSEGPAARHPSAVSGKTPHQKGTWLASHIHGSVKQSIPITFHPRKPPSYLLHHPISNVFGEADGFDFLIDGQMLELMKDRKTFPPKNLGCYQIALVSDGKVYGCCEGTVPIGKIDDKIEDLFDRLKARLEVWDKNNKISGCLGCSQPDFVCGMHHVILGIRRLAETPES